MIGLLVVTHGKLAAELVDATRQIVRRPAPMDSIALDWDDDPEQGRAQIERAIGKLDEGDGVIIATDMLGGTPANVAMTFLAENKVEVVTGVNLPMMIKFSNIREPNSLADAAKLLAEKGRSHITVAGEILAGSQGGGE